MTVSVAQALVAIFVAILAFGVLLFSRPIFDKLLDRYQRRIALGRRRWRRELFGPSSSFFKRYEINSRDSLREPYMVRYSLRLPRGWSLKLHKILRPDWTECQHDHPWRFWNLILLGGYNETNRDGVDRLGWLSCRYRPAEHSHRIDGLLRVPTWSLVLTAPKSRSWGFRNRSDDWTPWRPFVDGTLSDEEQIAWCEE